MSSISTIRLDNGWELNASEWLHQPRWSTIEFSRTSAVNLFAFNYTNGGQVSSIGLPRRTASELDTNQNKKGAMAQDEAMIVFAMTFEIYGLSDATFTQPNTGSPATAPEFGATNLRRLQRDAVVKLRVGAGIRKPQIGVPFAQLAQSIGPVGYGSGVGATDTRDQGTSGRVSGKNQRIQQLPIYIGGFGESQEPGNSMKFAVNFYNPSNIGGSTGIFQGLTQDCRLVITLDGLTSVPL